MKTKKVKYVLLFVALAALLAFTAVVPVACSCGEPKDPEINAPEFKVEKIVDFANGADRDVIFETDGYGNGSVFNVEWNDENVTYEDGVAKLAISEVPETAVSEYPYYGAELRTSKWYHYGFYSVSMKPSKDSGTASTFFTYTGPYGEYDEEGNLHPWDEIDIEFLGKDTTKVQFNYYVNGNGGHEHMYDLGFDASEEFHTYGFLWEEDAITWYVDGKPVYQVTEEAAGEDGLPSTPGRIMLNHWCGTEEAEGWMGEYTGYETSVQYQWIGATSDPIDPITTPPGGDDDTPVGGVSFTAGEAIAPAFVNASDPGAYTIETSADGKTVDVSYENVAAASYGENICTTAVTTAEGKNAYAMTVTNNGDTAVNLRVDVMDESIPVPEGVTSLNHKNLNTTAVQDGEIVAGATDKVWGGSKFTVGAGETSEIIVVYDTENFACGKDGQNDLYETTGNFSVSKVTVFLDGHMADGGPYSGDVTIADVNFGTAEVSESETPEAPEATVPENSDGAALTGFYQWGGYTLTPSADSTSLRITYGGLSEQYAGVGGSIASIVGTNNVVTLTVRNDASEAANVKIDVGYQPDGGNLVSTVTSAKYNDGTDHDIDISADGARFDVAANSTVTVTITFATEQAITNMNIFVDSLAADYATAAGNVVIGNVVFSGGEDPAPTPGGDEQPGGEDPTPTPGGDEQPGGEDPAPTPGGDEQPGGEDPAPTPGGDDEGEDPVPGDTYAPDLTFTTDGAYTVTKNADETIDVDYTAAGAYTVISAGLSDTDKTAIAGMNAFTITVKNNKDTELKVRIDIMDTSIVIPDGYYDDVELGPDESIKLNHQCLNKEGRMEDADADSYYEYTDSNWGGSFFKIAAGETKTLTVVYDTQNFSSGAQKSGTALEDCIITGDFAVTTVNIFFDTHGGQGPYAGSATISGFEFGTVDLAA